ncbi:MAG: hypothetical protein ACE5I2_13410 [Anaerolineae bacterium]
MPEVKVVLWGEYKRLAGGKRELTINLPEGSTAQILLERVAPLFGSAFAAKVFTHDGRIRHGVSIFLNGREIDTGGTLPSRTVVPGGQVEIMRLSAS